MERYLNRSSHVLWGEEDRKEGAPIGEEGRNSDTLWERERLFFDPGSLQLLWVVVVLLLLPAELWWLWMKRERRRGLGEIGSEEGEIGFVGMVDTDWVGFAWNVVFFNVFFFFKYCAEVRNCGRFRDFGYIYIYIY